MFFTPTAWHVSEFGVFPVHTFPHLDWIPAITEWISVFSPSTGKYGPKKCKIRTLFVQWPLCKWIDMFWSLPSLWREQCCWVKLLLNWDSDQSICRQKVAMNKNVSEHMSVNLAAGLELFKVANTLNVVFSLFKFNDYGVIDVVLDNIQHINQVFFVDNFKQVYSAMLHEKL